MNYLFIHQNFPGQFRHIVNSLACSHKNRIVAFGDARNLKRSNFSSPNVQLVGYTANTANDSSGHHYLKDFQLHIRRGQSIFRALLQLKNQFAPDVVVVHPAWGEGLFIKDVFPNAKVIAYAEFYYSSTDSDVGFDPEFPTSLDDQLRVRIKNSTQLHSLLQADTLVSPTYWQMSRYPVEFQHKLNVIHEGIDTNVVKPVPAASFLLQEYRFNYGDEIVTYCSRNLEPYRGFHTFIRSLPKLQALRPNVKVIVIGGDDVSYGKRTSDGQSYRQKYCDEVGGQVNWNNVYFLNKLPYESYLKVLQVSAVHVYLTYPFVLSWSMLEAMSSGCVLVASNTAPVKELINDGENGFLVDFFSFDELALKVAEALSNQSKLGFIRLNARNTIINKYDLYKICLPAWQALIN